MSRRALMAALLLHGPPGTGKTLIVRWQSWREAFGDPLLRFAASFAAKDPVLA